MARLISGRVKKVPSTEAASDRYEFLDLENAEPDLGVPASDGQVLASNTDGTRFWTTASGGGIEYIAKTANYTASDKDGIIADTSGGSFTITLPATPSTGNQVHIVDGDDWSNNNLTVARNGSTIEGTAEDLTVDVGGIGLIFIYDGSTWEIVVQGLGADPNITYLKSTDIGSTVQGYDATILTSSDIGSSVQGYDATILTSSDIGSSVQAYDSDLDTWSTKTAPSGTVVGTSDTQTLSNKTVEGLVLNDGYTEEVFAVTGTTPALSPTNGSIQTWTLSGSSTPTAGTWAAGQSITLLVDDGSAYTITWTSLSVTWKTDAGSAPTLETSGDTVIVLWKVGSTIYGARVGDA